MVLGIEARNCNFENFGSDDCVTLLNLSGLVGIALMELVQLRVGRLSGVSFRDFSVNQSILCEMPVWCCDLCVEPLVQN